MMMTLADLVSAVVDLVTSTVPDLAVFIAGGVVIAMAAVLFGRFVLRGR